MVFTHCHLRQWPITARRHFPDAEQRRESLRRRQSLIVKEAKGAATAKENTREGRASPRQLHASAAGLLHALSAHQPGHPS